MRSSADSREWTALDLGGMATAPAAEPSGAIALPELPDRGHGFDLEGDSPEEAAYERGFADGMADGHRRAAEQLRPLAQALEHVGRALAATQQDFGMDLSRNLYALAIAVAQKVIQREITADPALVTHLVEQAIGLLPQDTEFTVRLNPGDLERLGAEPGLRPAQGDITLSWVADPTLEPGSFLLQTPARLVDGRTDVALRMLYDRLAHDE